MEQFKVTKEGAEAALSELKRRVENLPELSFCHELTNKRPETRIYLVGGIVRDSVMGQESKDFDLLAEGFDKNDLENILKMLGKVQEVGRNFGVFKFVPGGFRDTIDIAVPRRDIHESVGKAADTKIETENIKIEDDLSRRDFTINAIGFDVESGEVIDPFSGVSDIATKTIRAVGDPRRRFREDPGRILRGVRFATKFNFDIESETLEAMTEQKDEIDKTIPGKFDKNGQSLSRVSYETIGGEVAKTLSANPEGFISWYEKTGLLNKFFPEVTALSGVLQPENYHSEGDAYVHTKLVIKNLPQEASLELKLAALLHDIGKADTYRQDESGKITFYGHAEKSSELARHILNRLKFKSNIKDKTLWLIENHMNMLVNFPQKPHKQRQLIKHQYFNDAIALSVADAKSSIRSDGSVDLSFLEPIKTAIEKLQRDEEARGPELGLNGLEIIDQLKTLQPGFDQAKDGRLVGTIKKDLEQKFFDGIVKDKQEALKYLSQNIHSYIDSD